MIDYLNTPVTLRGTSEKFSKLVFVPFEKIDEIRYLCHKYNSPDDYRQRKENIGELYLDSRLFLVAQVNTTLEFNIDLSTK